MVGVRATSERQTFEVRRARPSEDGRLDVNTERLYIPKMASRLLNVRLSPADEQIVARLKARGISLSEVMRRALRAEETQATGQSVDPEALVADMLATYPTPKGARAGAIRATDRHAVRKHIQARLRARR